MEELKAEVIKTLLYFDIFSFPLTMEEIHLYCGKKANHLAISAALIDLMLEAKLYKVEDYYLVRYRPDWIEQRKANHRRSIKKMKIAKRNAGLINAFPFVRGVAISGSLSKYAADEKADIDYFIIAHAQRLWICRSFLHLFKKVTYLFGMQHDFCMNFFLDQSELELKDKNLYTAIEGATIVPIYGVAAHQAFFEQNNWILKYFPNLNWSEKIKTILVPKKYYIKKALETLLGGKFGNYINQWLYEFTTNWWKKKFKKNEYSKDYFDHDVRTTPGESKYHPNDYQPLILSAFNERMDAYQAGEMGRVQSNRLGS